MRKLLLTTILLTGLLGLGCSGKKEVGVIYTGYGQIVLQLHPRQAPHHVARFKQLAGSGFYDGSQVHYTWPGFKIQLGDPTTAIPETPRTRYGEGGSDVKLEPEFSELKHVRGAVGMARRADPASGQREFLNTADSQFYILLSDKPHLDGKYTLFATVVQGIEIADRIASFERDLLNIPLVPVFVDSIRIEQREPAN